jgi:hypothetical protein
MSDEELAKRVRAAAGAGWWTVLVLAVWMVGAWVFWLAIMHLRPMWLVPLWGGDADDKFFWDRAQTASLLVMGGMKVLLMALVAACIWLSLWARRLSPPGR